MILFVWNIMYTCMRGRALMRGGGGRWGSRSVWIGCDWPQTDTHGAEVQLNLSKQPVELGLQLSLDCISVPLSLVLCFHLVSEQRNTLAK